MTLAAGSRLGPYEIVSQLGQGGMGIVHLAHDPRLDRHVAIKLLPPDLTRDETAKQRFLQEAKAASALDHPNICTIFEINETDDGQLYLVMAHYEGETLKERIERGPVELDDAIDIATQVGQGLAKAHEAGIVHRDIKPANLMVTTDGTVKILDFGLAKLAGTEGVTQTGTTVGTVAYMSPEQARGQEVDHRTDIWSLGVVLYEMLTGVPPFQGENLLAIASAIGDKEPSSLCASAAEVPIELERTTLRLLSKHPDARYQDLAAVLVDLNTVRWSGSPVAAEPDPTGRNTRRSNVGSYAQEIRFCTTEDHVSLAYACVGAGHPLVRALGWFSHLEVEWEWPAGRRFWERLARRHLLVRYDGRGIGLSDRHIDEISLETRVRDLEAVVAAAGVDRFALLGTSEGGATAITYAARHPDRVSHLILYGAFGQLIEDEREREKRAALITLIRQGWGSDAAVFRQVFTGMFLPDGDAEQVRYFNAMQRVSASPEMAARYLGSFSDINVSTIASTIRTPTLVVHRRGDIAVPFERGRKLAALIPRARFFPMEGNNHWLLVDEPEAARIYADAIEQFIDTGSMP